MTQKEKLKEAKRLYETANSDQRYVLESLFPELKESEDEKIRKEIIKLVKFYYGSSLVLKHTVSKAEMVDWLEKQGEQEQLYIRFGEIPTNEKSKIFQGEIEVGTENGVSVYPAFKTSEGDIILGLVLPITKTTLHTQQHLIEYDDRPCYLVKGNYVGKDTDGQPLINNVSIIKKIDSYRVKEEKQGEQKPTIIIPRFRVGDEIKTTNEAPLTITDITDSGYWSDDLFICSFENSTKWELFEQKPANKVEPKFNEGDWTVSNLDGKARQVSEVHFDEYNSYYVVNGMLINLEEFDRRHHLWTIEDAKDGDVLVSQYNKPFIYNGNLDSFHIGSYCGISVADSFTVATEKCHWTENTSIYPATKEQRDLLFQKMKEAGYEWDSEKKELKKIEQKSAWSEDDDAYKLFAISAVEDYYDVKNPLQKALIDWLKSLKQRIGG